MTVAAIIMECNPFHEGHQYIINEARRITNADYVLVILSGDYVQRGIPAIVSKEQRAIDVLTAGADLVIELPLTYSTGSAEYFARGAVRTVCSLGVVTDLVFGAANADIEYLRRIADLLSSESPEYQEALKSHLRSGLSYPSARSRAAAQILGMELPTVGNDILGMEYLQALRDFDPDGTITVHPVPRVDVMSATEHRARMLQERSHDTTAPDKIYLDANDFSGPLYYRLLALTGLCSCAARTDTDNAQAVEALTAFLDIDNDLAFRILGELPSFHDWNSFCLSLKTKNITYARVSRALMHILLDIRKVDLEALDAFSHCGYARVLGFRKSAGSLMKAIHARGAVPLITSPRAAIDDTSIDAVWRVQLLRDCKASELYDHIAMQGHDHDSPMSEFTKQPVMI